MKCCNILFGAPIFTPPALSASSEVRESPPLHSHPAMPELVALRRQKVVIVMGSQNQEQILRKKKQVAHFIVSRFQSSHKLLHSPGGPGLNQPLLDVSNEKQQDWSQEVLLRSIENTVGGEIGSSVSWVMDFSLYDCWQEDNDVRWWWGRDAKTFLVLLIHLIWSLMFSHAGSSMHGNACLLVH